MSVDLSNAVAVITGAGSGVGRATAHSFARRGTRVVVTDIDADRAFWSRPSWVTMALRCAATSPVSKTWKPPETSPWNDSVVSTS